MFIIYRDSIGTVAVDNLTTTVFILEGYAYFSDGERDYKISVNDIVEIGLEGGY